MGGAHPTMAHSARANEKNPLAPEAPATGDIAAMNKQVLMQKVAQSGSVCARFVPRISAANRAILLAQLMAFTSFRWNALRRSSRLRSGSKSAPMPRAGDGCFSGVRVSCAAAFRDVWEVGDKIASVDTNDTIRSLWLQVAGSPLSAFEDCKMCVQSTGSLFEGCTKVAKMAASLRVQSSWTAG